jgi:putative Mn2+ efflux pump MntP
MKPSAAGKVVAACFGLAAFAVGVLSGLVSENPAAQILLRSLLSMAVCYPIGYLVGLICQRVVDEQIAKHRIANPVVIASDDGAPSESRGSGKDAAEEAIVL